MMDYTNTMLISPKDLKVNEYVDMNLSDASQAEAIRTAQETFLRDIIGDALLDRLKELTYNSIKEQSPSIDEPEYEQYLVLLDEYVTPYLAYKSTSEVLLPISLKIRNVGVAQDSDVNINASYLSDIKFLKSEMEHVVADKANRISSFLCEHRNSFEELDEKSGKQARVGAKYANINLWLGGNNDNKCGCR